MNPNKFSRREAKRDMKSVERFEAMRSALSGERTPSRMARIASGVLQVAHVVQDTIREGREADREIALANAQDHLEQGYSTEEDLRTLRESGQPVLIKMPWQQ